MEFRCDAMLFSNMRNENSDAGHVKCSRGPQVPHPCTIPLLGKLRLADMFCVVLPAELQYLKLTASCHLILMFVSFINVFTWICKVSCQGVCRSFYVKLAFFIELYLTLQTYFFVRGHFRFSANDSSVEEVCPPLYYCRCRIADKKLGKYLQVSLCFTVGKIVHFFLSVLNLQTCVKATAVILLPHQQFGKVRHLSKCVGWCLAQAPPGGEGAVDSTSSKVAPKKFRLIKALMCRPKPKKDFSANQRNCAQRTCCILHQFFCRSWSERGLLTNNPWSFKHFVSFVVDSLYVVQIQYNG